MTRPNPVPWSKIDGGRPAFMRAYFDHTDEIAGRQLRLMATLDALGPPGGAVGDPRTARLTLRRRQFRAQCLGSFDGKSWLWSWANPGAAIPAAHLTLATGARDAARGLGAAGFTTPMIEDGDDSLPAMIGGLCCARGFGEAFWIADGRQLYALLPGQLDPRAWIPAGSPFDRVALCFSRRRRSLIDLVAYLQADPALAHVDFVQYGADRVTAADAGYGLVIRRVEDPDTLRREVRGLYDDGHPARRVVTLFVIESSIDGEYEGRTYPFVRPGLWPAGPRAVAAEAVAVSQRLNQLDDVSVLDVLHRSWYPLH